MGQWYRKVKVATRTFEISFNLDCSMTLEQSPNFAATSAMVGSIAMRSVYASAFCGWSVIEQGNPTSDPAHKGIVQIRYSLQCLNAFPVEGYFVNNNGGSYWGITALTGSGTISFTGDLYAEYTDVREFGHPYPNETVAYYFMLPAGSTINVTVSTSEGGGSASITVPQDTVIFLDESSLIGESPTHVMPTFMVDCTGGGNFRDCHRTAQGETTYSVACNGSDMYLTQFSPVAIDYSREFATGNFGIEQMQISPGRAYGKATYSGPWSNFSDNNGVSVGAGGSISLTPATKLVLDIHAEGMDEAWANGPFLTYITGYQGTNIQHRQSNYNWSANVPSDSPATLPDMGHYDFNMQIPNFRSADLADYQAMFGGRVSYDFRNSILTVRGGTSNWDFLTVYPTSPTHHPTLSYAMMAGPAVATTLVNHKTSEVLDDLSSTSGWQDKSNCSISATGGGITLTGTGESPKPKVWKAFNPVKEVYAWRYLAVRIYSAGDNRKNVSVQLFYPTRGLMKWSVPADGQEYYLDLICPGNATVFKGGPLDMFVANGVLDQLGGPVFLGQSEDETTTLDGATWPAIPLEIELQDSGVAYEVRQLTFKQKKKAFITPLTTQLYDWQENNPSLSPPLLRTPFELGSSLTRLVYGFSDSKLALSQNNSNKSVSQFIAKLQQRAGWNVSSLSPVTPLLDGNSRAEWIGGAQGFTRRSGAWNSNFNQECPATIYGQPFCRWLLFPPGIGDVTDGNYLGDTVYLRVAIRAGNRLRGAIFSKSNTPKPGAAVTEKDDTFGLTSAGNGADEIGQYLVTGPYLYTHGSAWVEGFKEQTEETLTLSTLYELNRNYRVGISRIAVALESGEIGYWIAMTTSSGLLVRRSWDAQQSLDLEVTVDDRDDLSEPRLEYRPWDGLLTLLWHRGTDPKEVWRAYSWDHGETWVFDPDPETPYRTDIMHAREVFDDTMNERHFFYQNSDGLIQVDIYDATETLVGTFPEDGLGIGGVTADDSSFDARYINASYLHTDVVMAVSEELRRFRSYDGSRTWVEIS